LDVDFAACLDGFAETFLVRPLVADDADAFLRDEV